MEITAAVLRETNGPFHLETVELAEPGAGEVLVRLVATGICHTDMVVRQGMVPLQWPAVLGHEGAGIVERVGPGVVKVGPGDPVVLTFASCGVCASCASHAPAYCDRMYALNMSGTRGDGLTSISKGAERIAGNFFGQSSFATYALAHERNTVKVPAEAPLELLGPLGCGIQTGAGAVINSLKVGVGASIAVFGTGAVGLSAILAARVVGAAAIVAIDKNPARLQLALELGATHAIDPAQAGPKLAKAVRAIPGLAAGVDFSLDTTALMPVLSQAFEALGPRGTCGVLGVSEPSAELSVSIGRLMGGGKSIRGIVEGDSDPDLFIPKLIALHAQGRFPFDRLVRFYPFASIGEAMHDAETGITIKPILRFAA